jgi:hypothetical protein
LNVHGINDVRQREIHAAEPLVSEPSSVEVEIAIEKLKGINHQELTKFRQNWFKQEVKHYVLISMDFSLLFGLRRNFLNSGSLSITSLARII